MGCIGGQHFFICPFSSINLLSCLVRLQFQTLAANVPYHHSLLVFTVYGALVRTTDPEADVIILHLESQCRSFHCYLSHLDIVSVFSHEKSSALERQDAHVMNSLSSTVIEKSYSLLLNYCHITSILFRAAHKEELCGNLLMIIERVADAIHSHVSSIEHFSAAFHLRET